MADGAFLKAPSVSARVGALRGRTVHLQTASTLSSRSSLGRPACGEDRDLRRAELLADLELAPETLAELRASQRSKNVKSRPVTCTATLWTVTSPMVPRAVP